MPQFELENFVPQLVWLTIFFAILYFGIVKLTLPRLGRVMQERESTVADDIATADSAKQEADRIAAEYEAAIAEAQGRSRAQIGEAKSAAARAVEQRLAALAAQLDEQQRAAEADLDVARRQGLDQIQAVAAEAASDIVERLIGSRPERDEATRAADSALAETV